jgi:hypothetical protein
MQFASYPVPYGQLPSVNDVTIIPPGSVQLEQDLQDLLLQSQVFIWIFCTHRSRPVGGHGLYPRQLVNGHGWVRGRFEKKPKCPYWLARKSDLHNSEWVATADFSLPLSDGLLRPRMRKLSSLRGARLLALNY